MNFLIAIVFVLVAPTVIAQQQCGQTPIPPHISREGEEEIVGGTNAVPYSWPWQVVWCEHSGTYRILRNTSTVLLLFEPFYEQKLRVRKSKKVASFGENFYHFPHKSVDFQAFYAKVRLHLSL
jgi:hypothetical protein